jgi:hypothetical protein
MSTSVKYKVIFCNLRPDQFEPYKHLRVVVILSGRCSLLLLLLVLDCYFFFCTWGFSRIWQRQPKRDDDGEKEEICDALLPRARPGQVQRRSLLVVVPAPASRRVDLGLRRLLLSTLREKRGSLVV